MIPAPTLLELILLVCLPLAGGLIGVAIAFGIYAAAEWIAEFVRDIR